MAYEVVVKSTNPSLAADSELYRQTVEELDLKKIIAAVNSKPRKPRASRVTPPKP